VRQGEMTLIMTVRKFNLIFDLSDRMLHSPSTYLCCTCHALITARDDKDRSC
jgi:hypothetical protein